jgi:hypothetical protein
MVIQVTLGNGSEVEKLISELRKGRERPKNEAHK